MKTSWEKISGGITHYIRINENEVVSGSHAGSGHTDNAGTCSYEEFLEGRFQDIIKREFGGRVLAEVILSVRGAENWEPFRRKRAEADERRAFIYTVPESNKVRELLENPEIERGGRYYGKPSGYDTELESGGFLFRTDTSDMSDVKGTITCTGTGESFGFNLPGYCSAVVEVNEKFFLISRENFFVINCRGEILWSTMNLKDRRGENLAGNSLRAQTVSKSGNSVLVLFSWVGPPEPRTWMLFDPEKLHFTARHTAGAG